MGEFSPPLFLSPLLSFLFLIPQILIGSNTLLQKFTPHFKILDPRLTCFNSKPKRIHREIKIQFHYICKYATTKPVNSVYPAGFY